MMMKISQKFLNTVLHHWKAIALLTLVTVALFLTVDYFVPAKKNNMTSKQLKTETIAVGDGYGYQVWYGEDVLIRQENIPGLQGHVTFQNVNDALRVGDLIVHRLNHGKNPEITLRDLENLEVTTPNLVANQ